MIHSFTEKETFMFFLGRIEDSRKQINPRYPDVDIEIYLSTLLTDFTNPNFVKTVNRWSERIKGSKHNLKW